MTKKLIACSWLVLIAFLATACGGDEEVPPTFPAGVECYTRDDCMEGRFDFMNHNCVLPTCTSARKCTYARNTGYSTCECLLPKPGTSASSRCIIPGTTTYGYRTCQKRGTYETRWTMCR